MATDRSGLRAPTAVPRRTCVGCRRPDSRSALLRVVAVAVSDGRTSVVPDVRQRMPGRGAWLHPTSECLARAQRRRALVRALKVLGPADDEAVAAYVRDRGQQQESTVPGQPKAG